MQSFTLGGVGLHTGEYGAHAAPLSMLLTHACESKPLPTTAVAAPFAPWQTAYHPFAQKHRTPNPSRPLNSPPHPPSSSTAVVRVRPAFAGEGRYFVRVPPGTNQERFEIDTSKDLKFEEEEFGACVSTSLSVCLRVKT